MGANNSISRQNEQNVYAELKRRAFEIYKHRVENYNYAYHGPYHKYLRYIQAQYELDCLPNSIKYGRNYNQNN